MNSLLRFAVLAIVSVGLCASAPAAEPASKPDAKCDASCCGTTKAKTAKKSARCKKCTTAPKTT